VFIFTVSIALVLGQERQPDEATVRRLLRMVLISGGGLATLGLVDFLIWPSLLPGLPNGLAGTFRNTGQAGSFFGTYLALIVPAFLSGLLAANRRNIVIATII